MAEVELKGLRKKPHCTDVSCVFISGNTKCVTFSIYKIKYDIPSLVPSSV